MRLFCCPNSGQSSGVKREGWRIFRKTLLGDAMLKKIFAALVPLLMLCLSISVIQADDEPAGWPVEQRCITPTKPPKGWTFDGTLITMGNDWKIRGLRSDLPTSYIIAFGGKDYTSASSLSPNGNWLAVPNGWSSHAWGNYREFHILRIHVYSTDVRQKTYSIPWKSEVQSLSEDYLPGPQWLGDTQFYIYRNVKSSIINPFTREIIPFDNRLNGPGFVSPDKTRTLINQFFGNEFVGVELQDTAAKQQLAQLKVGLHPMPQIWKPDSSEFATVTSEQVGKSRIILYSRDGKQGNIIAEDGALDGYSRAWSPDSRYLMFYHYTQDAQGLSYTIWIADTQQKKVIDTCLPTSWLGQAAWASDSQRVLATVIDNQVSYATIINLADQTAYRVQKDVFRILGWRPAD
jgi:hypothetical protein